MARTDRNTEALRVSIWPNDVHGLGSYSIGMSSGTIAAGASANAPIFSLRWGNSSGKVAVIKSVKITAASLATGFTAGLSLFDLFVARSYSIVDTGGVSADFASVANSNKRKTGFGASLMTDIQIANTGALTPGTRTLDSAPLVKLGPFTTTNAAQTVFVPEGTKFLGKDNDGEHPLVLGASEGLVIQATVPATGTWRVTVNVEWSEFHRYFSDAQ